MKNFAEKLRDAREYIDISQTELAERAGISQRSITSYENENIIPRGNTIRKLAKALDVSVDYLMNENISDPEEGKYKDAFLDTAKDRFGPKGENEAKLLLEQNKALFAGGALDQEAKDAFFEALMIAYVQCKEEAKESYGKNSK